MHFFIHLLMLLLSSRVKGKGDANDSIGGSGEGSGDSGIEGSGDSGIEDEDGNDDDVPKKALHVLFVSTNGRDSASCGADVPSACQTIQFTLGKVRVPYRWQKLNIVIFLVPGATPHVIESTVMLKKKSYVLTIFLQSYRGLAEITSSNMIKNGPMFSLVTEPGFRYVCLSFKNIKFVNCRSLLSIKAKSVFKRYLPKVQVKFHNVLYTSSSGLFLGVNGKGVDIDILLLRCFIVKNRFYNGQGLISMKTRSYYVSDTKITINQSKFFKNLLFDTRLIFISGHFLEMSTMAFTLSNTFIEGNEEMANSSSNSLWYIAGGRSKFNLSMKSLRISSNILKDESRMIFPMGEADIYISSSDISNNSFPKRYIFALFIAYSRGMYHSNSIQISNSSFTDNRKSFVLAIFVYDENVDISLSKCHFRNNTARSGGAMIIHLFEKVNVSIKLQHNRFIGNKALYGGAVLLSSQRAQKQIKFEIKDCWFAENIAKVGGAVLIKTVFPQKINFSVSTSIFIGNSASRSAGAISVFGNPLSEVRSLLSGNRFINNKAPFGGALSSNVGGFFIRYSGFEFNEGHTGGALYLIGKQASSIKNTFFKSDKMTITECRSRLKMFNVTLKMTDQVFKGYKRAVEICNYRGESLEIRAPFLIRCPPNYKLTTTSRFVRVNHRSGEYVDSTKFSQLIATCIPCTGRYHYDLVKYSWSNNSVNGNDKICKPCPSGGLCNPGTLINLPHYWGYRKNNDVKFSYCKHGYCSVDFRTYNSCVENRTGALCSLCKEDYILTLFSSRCIRKDDCSTMKSCLVLFLGIPFAFTFLMVLTIIRKMRHLHSREPSYHFVAIRALYVFYQLQLLTNVPAHHGSGFFRNIHTVMGMVFQLKLHNIEQSQHFNSLRDICLHNELTYVMKSGFTVVVWSGLFFCFVVISLMYYCVAKLKSNRTSGGWMIAQTSVIMILLSYIPLTITLMELVKCSPIYDDREKKDMKILFTQADIRCYTHWQIALVVVLLVGFFSFPLALYGAARKIIGRGKNGHPDGSHGMFQQTREEKGKKVETMTDCGQLQRQMTYALFWGPFTHPSHLSLEVLMHLVLVAVYVHVDYVLGRLYIFSFVMFMHFIFIWCVNRYKDTALNQLDKMLTTILMFFSWLGLYDTINIYNSAKVGEKRHGFHQASNLLKLGMLNFPIIIIVLHIIKTIVQQRT